MATSRFFLPRALHAHAQFELPANLAHYALRVLRLSAGDELIVFDGRGGEYGATLHSDGKNASIWTHEHNPIEAELDGAITLVQGLASGDKMDWIIEKATELGARRVVPVSAQRSVLQLRGDRLAKRQQHWERVAQSASEQCGRNRILDIAPVTTLDAFFNENPCAESLVLFCDPDAQRPLHEVLLSSPVSSVTLLVGPEGGWSEQEQAMVACHPAIAVRFGKRILRTETAGLALIAATSAALGWA